MIAASLQLVAPFHAAKAPFKARSPSPPPSEPALRFVGEPLARLGAGLGPHPWRNAGRRGIPRIGGGVHPASRREQAGKTREEAQMLLPTGRQLGVLGRSAVPDDVPADNAALDCSHPEHAPTCRRPSRLPGADDRRLQLKQAHPVLGRGHDGPLHAPAGCRCDAWVDQGDDTRHGRRPWVPTRRRLGRADGGPDRLARPGTAGRRRVGAPVGSAPGPAPDARLAPGPISGSVSAEPATWATLPPIGPASAHEITRKQEGFAP